MTGSSMDDIKKQIRDAIQMDYVVPEDIPEIELYMDQVTTFMEQHMQNNKRTPEDKILTKTMINNYTKNHLLPPPEKKKYSKDHIILMLYTYYLKNFLSIGDIQTLLTPMIDSYYGAEGSSTSLTDIYETVVELAQHQYQYDKKNIFETYELVHQKLITDQLITDQVSPDSSATEAGTSGRKAPAGNNNDNNDTKNAEYLQDFLFVAMLSYDIYLKTQLVEKIIDDMTPISEDSSDKNRTKDKIKEKNKEKPKDKIKEKDRSREKAISHNHNDH